jgi:hypothetical protein
MSSSKESRTFRDVAERAAKHEHGTVVRLPVPARTVQRQGPPARRRNKDVRQREYLTRPSRNQTG